MKNNYIFSKKTPINVDNEFLLDDFKFVIPRDNEEYKVTSRYDEVDEYTNESKMDSVTVTLGSDFKLYFYNENGEIIDDVKFKK